MTSASTARLSALLTVAAVLAGLPAVANQPGPQDLPTVLPPDHSDTTETHGCLCEDWILGLTNAQGEPIALASIDPRQDIFEPETDAGSLAETRHLNATLQPRLLRIDYRFDLPPDEAKLLLASTGALESDIGTCRIRATITTLADIEFPELTYLSEFDWMVPADEVANRIHLAGLAPVSGDGLGLPAGVPGCTGPTDAELRRFFADGAPIQLAGPLPPGTSIEIPLPPSRTTVPRVLVPTPPGGGGTPLIPVGGGGGNPPGSEDPDDPDGPDDPGGPTTPVPVPAAFWLLLGGLGLLAGGRLLGRRAA